MDTNKNNNGSDMDTQELAERLLVIKNLQGSVDVVKDTNRREESLLKLWKFMFEIVFVVLIFAAFKILAFVSFWQAHYRDFITFIEKYRNTLDSNGKAVYAGPRGLTTALALESNILLLTFDNAYFPESMYMLYATPSLNEYLSKPGGENIPQLMYILSIEGTPEIGKLNATQIICTAIKQLFPDFDDNMCGSVCSVNSGNASMPFGQRMLNGAVQNGASGGMVGHVIGVGLNPGMGAALGIVGGIAVGAVSAYLEQKQADDICSLGRKYCNNQS